MEKQNELLINEAKSNNFSVKSNKMSRYIDADALVKRLKHSPLFLGTNMQFKDGVVDLVEKQPTADVVEVRYGEWKMTDFDCVEMSCSVCGFKYYGEYDKECMSKYCPECGAYMRGTNNGEE